MRFKGMKTLMPKTLEIKTCENSDAVHTTHRSILKRVFSMTFAVAMSVQTIAHASVSGAPIDPKKLPAIDAVELYEIKTLANGSTKNILIGKKLKTDLGFKVVKTNSIVGSGGLSSGRQFLLGGAQKTTAAETDSADNKSADDKVNKALEDVIGDLLSGVIGDAASGTPIGAYITVGRLVYDIVKKNKPVTDIKMDQSVSVMPIDPKNWNTMGGWKGPFYKTYKIDYKNMGGSNTAISLTYQISYFAKGSYKGKGQYLADVKVKPKNVYVTWGYNLEAGVETSEVVNMGTEDSPIPGIHLQVKYKTSTLFQSDSNDIGYVIRGDGQIIEMK